MNESTGPALPPSPAGDGPGSDGPGTDGSGSDGSEESQRRLLAAAVRHSRLSLKDLWLHYFSIGGNAGEYELDAYIHASYFLPTLQHDILAQAVNEMIDMLPAAPRAPFSDDAAASGGTTEVYEG